MPVKRATRPRRFSRALAAALDECTYLGVRAGSGTDHRFIHIWVVVVDGRAFARSWTVRPGGWFRAFQDDPRGWLKIGEREVRVRAVPARALATLKAMERAYGQKYVTPASKRYVRGFRTARRRAASVEFLPR